MKKILKRLVDDINIALKSCSCFLHLVDDMFIQTINYTQWRDDFDQFGDSCIGLGQSTVNSVNVEVLLTSNNHERNILETY